MSSFQVVALKMLLKMKSVDFSKESMIHRFVIPKILTIDQGIMFVLRVVKYANSKKIMLLTLTPYYVQVNRQVEATNKMIIVMVKKANCLTI